MVQIKSNSDLIANEMASIEEGKQANKPLVSSLAAHVKDAFSRAENHRQTTGITERLLKSRRLKQGIYSSDQSQAIRNKGGSQLFFNITETKCESFVAWLEDIFSPEGENIWDIEPTPIPTLEENYVQNVLNQVVERFSMMDVQPDPEEVKNFTNEVYDEALNQLREDAERRLSRMMQKMEDQIAEGCWDNALSDFISDLSTYPTAFLKGPVMTNKRRLKYNRGKIEVATEVVPTWYCVDPMNIYPGPNCRNTNEGYICELVTFDRSELANMRGQDSWNDNAINSVLGMTAMPGNSLGVPYEAGSSEKAALEDREDTENEGLADSTLKGIEYWGKIQGRVLLDWGMDRAKIQDENNFYEVQCVMIGNIVVKAKLNPHPLGKRIYYAASFIKNKNSIWGVKSIPEKMEDCQEAVNGTSRNLLNNLAMSSGPMCAIDLDTIPAEYLPTIHKMTPWKFYGYRGSKRNGGGDPIKFFQPDANVDALMKVNDFFENKADDRTMIPKYVYGDQDLSGAAATASGLSMLMSSSNRGMKRVIKNVDKYVTRPAMETLYLFNMLDPNINDNHKGDAQIVPRGALAILVKEQVQLRRQEFLASTNNPSDLQIIGIRGRANVLRKVAEGLDMQVDKIVPSDEELAERERMMQEQQAMEIETTGQEVQ